MTVCKKNLFSMFPGYISVFYLMISDFRESAETIYGLIRFSIVGMSGKVAHDQVVLLLERSIAIPDYIRRGTYIVKFVQ